MPIATVGELRALLANVPDERPLAVYSGSVESFVNFSIAECDVDDDGTESTVIYAEN